MDIKTDITQTITFDLDGSGHFEIELNNNKISSLEFKSQSGEMEEHLISKNEKHLRNINKALTSLFEHMEKNNGGET